MLAPSFKGFMLVPSPPRYWEPDVSMQSLRKRHILGSFVLRDLYCGSQNICPKFARWKIPESTVEKQAYALRNKKKRKGKKKNRNGFKCYRCTIQVYHPGVPPRCTAQGRQKGQGVPLLGTKGFHMPQQGSAGVKHWQGLGGSTVSVSGWMAPLFLGMGKKESHSGRTVGTPGSFFHGEQEAKR